jgi:hypothetical protein
MFFSFYIIAIRVCSPMLGKAAPAFFDAQNGYFELISMAGRLHFTLIGLINYQNACQH